MCLDPFVQHKTTSSDIFWYKQTQDYKIQGYSLFTLVKDDNSYFMIHDNQVSMIIELWDIEI